LNNPEEVTYKNEVNNLKDKNLNKKNDTNVRKSDTTGRLPRYEKFSAVLLLVAGFIYLALWLISIFSETTSFINMTDNKVSMNLSELLSHIRTVITIGLALGGGFLIFINSRPGWVMGIVVLILFLIICSGAFYQAFKLKEPISITITATAWLILLLSIVFLTIPSSLKKFNITKPTIITATMLALILATFYFFIQ
jgi:magnesium-transporting ATPase (P-type)